VEGARNYLPDNSVDLIICDPPYGIAGDTLHKHYNRNETLVLDGYVEVPAEEYPAFSLAWIKEAERVLRPGGSLYIVSGYSNLIHVLNALHNTSLQEVNHIIWKYNFGVYTRKKYISSHYHILYYVKPGGQPVFNTFSRYGEMEKNDESSGSLNYQDREDVWVINKEYKPGKIKNKNELPSQLLIKMIQYSSNEGDLVCDFFLGSFSTAKVAIGLNRRACGFEKSRVAFDYQIREMEKIVPGSLLATLRTPAPRIRTRQGERITDEERERVKQRFFELKAQKMTQKEAIHQMSEEFGRGYWSLLRMLQ
jgi:site-specific DNA-methyltransferase (adenine-specific)